MVNVKKKKLCCPYKDGNLYGELYLPEPMDGEIVPFIILSHGMFSSYLDTGVSAQFLASHGFGCYCFDYKGCSYTNRSGGDLKNCSILTEKDELEVVISYLKRQSFVDTERLYLLGQSLGGLVTSMAAADHPDDICAMVLMYPAFNAVDYISKMFISSDNIPEVVENYMGIQGLNLGRRFFKDVMDASISDFIFDYPGFVYILHGTGDTLVPENYSKEAKERFAGAQLELVKGFGHGFHLDENNGVGVLDFLRSRVCTDI